MDSLTQHQKDTPTMLKSSSEMWFLFGFCITQLTLIVVILLAQSGDSVKQKQQREALRTLTMPPSTVIR